MLYAVEHAELQLHYSVCFEFRQAKKFTADWLVKGAHRYTQNKPNFTSEAAGICQNYSVTLKIVLCRTKLVKA